MEEVRKRVPHLFEQIESDIRDKNWETITEGLSKLLWLKDEDSLRVVTGFIELADNAACEKMIQGDTFTIVSFPAAQNFVNGLVFRETNKVIRKVLVSSIFEMITKLKFFTVAKLRFNSQVSDPYDLVQSLLEIFNAFQDWVLIACMHICPKFEKTHKKSLKSYLSDIFNNEVIFVITCRFKDRGEVMSLVREFAPKVQNKYSYNLVPRNLYFGELSPDGLREGFGRVSLSNGEKYEGFWSKDLFNGEGLYIWKKEEWFKGNFVDGQMNGTGKRKFKNGSVYLGEFLKGKMHGLGKIVFKNGDVYQGSFVNDTMSGHGEYVWAKSGDKFKGTMKGDIRQSGVIFLENGEEYKV